jgi:hypothetical protein
MRHMDFTLGDMKESPPFRSMITEGAAFQFDQSVIPRIRSEIATLIDKLSQIYLPIRKELDEAEKKAKQPRKRARSRSSTRIATKSADDEEVEEEASKDKSKCQINNNKEMENVTNADENDDDNDVVGGGRCDNDDLMDKDDDEDCENPKMVTPEAKSMIVAKTNEVPDHVADAVAPMGTGKGRMATKTADHNVDDISLVGSESRQQEECTHQIVWTYPPCTLNNSQQYLQCSVCGCINPNLRSAQRRAVQNANTESSVQADDRIPVRIFPESPQVPWMQPHDVSTLKGLLEKNHKTLFENLVGGSAGRKTLRQYTPNLSANMEVYNLVAKCILPYIKFVQREYPALRICKLSVLRSFPHAKSQYEQCFQKLHSDYDNTVNSRQPHERPVSLMVALDEFDFMHLNNRGDKRSEIITRTIKSGQAIAFTNYCLHAGGANNTNKMCYRMFAYMVINPKDIPNGNVYQYLWQGEGNNTDDDVIKIVASDLPIRKELDEAENKAKQATKRARSRSSTPKRARSCSSTPKRARSRSSTPKRARSRSSTPKRARSRSSTRIAAKSVDQSTKKVGQKEHEHRNKSKV